MPTVEPLYSEDTENPGLKLHHFHTLNGKQLTSEAEVIKNSLAEYFALAYQEEITYSIGVIEQGVTNEKDLNKHEGKSLQFSSGDRFFFSNKDDIRNQIFPNPSDGAAYGSNVFTECNEFYQVKGAKVLIIDDDEVDKITGEISGENGGEIPIELAKKLVHDCYGKIDKSLHHQLGNDLDEDGNPREDINTPFQFRFGTNPSENDPVHRLAKGTLAPRNLKEITGGKHYDLVLPKSAFKGRKGETAIQPGEYKWDFGLGNKTNAYSSEQSLGAQALGFYPKGVEADVKPMVEKKAKALAEMRGDPRKIAIAYVESEQKRLEFSSQEKELEDVTINNFDQETSSQELSQITEIIKNDSENYSQLLEHSKIADTLNNYTQKQYKELAMGRAFKFKGSLLQPHPDLKPGEVCDPHKQDGEEIIVLRSPVLNSNGVTVLTNRHLDDFEAMKDQGVIFMNPKDAASILQGDFDGDRVAYDRASKYPTLAAEIKERQKPENRYAQIEKKDKVPYSGSFEEIALAQSQDQIGLIANQVMKSEALKLECYTCPDDQKREFYQEQQQAFQELLKNELSSVVTQDKYGQKILSAMARVANSNPSRMRDEQINKGLEFIAKEIHSSNVSLMGNQLQIAVDGPKSSARPEQEIVDFSRAYSSKLSVAWLDDRKSNETYSRREMKSNRHGPIDSLVQTVNSEYQSSELEKRKSYEFQTLFSYNFAPEHSKKAMELNDEFNRINGQAQALKKEVNESDSSVKIALTGKSGKTIYTDRIAQTCNLENVREWEGKEVEFKLIAPNPTKINQQWTVIGRKKGSDEKPKRIGFVTPSSERELKNTLPKITGKYTIANLELQHQVTQSQVGATFKNINNWIDQKREEIKDPLERKKVAAALWSYNNKRQGDEKGEQKGYREYNKATASFRLFGKEIAEQLKEQQFTELTVSTREEAQQEKATSLIKGEESVPLTIKKTEDNYYGIFLNNDEEFQIGVLVQESPKITPGKLSFNSPKHWIKQQHC